MLSKDNTCRARCSLNFGAIARESERGSCAKKSNVARNASRWNGSQLQEDVRAECGAASLQYILTM